jgi:hypothetical protein
LKHRSPLLKLRSPLKLLPLLLLLRLPPLPLLRLPLLLLLRLLPLPRLRPPPPPLLRPPPLLLLRLPLLPRRSNSSPALGQKKPTFGSAFLLPGCGDSSSEIAPVKTPVLGRDPYPVLLASKHSRQRCPSQLRAVVFLREMCGHHVSQTGAPYLR